MVRSMRQVSVSLILAGTLALSGCKVDHASMTSSQLDSNASGKPATHMQSAGTPDQAPVGLPSSPLDPRPLVVCFGDSLTAGFGADDGQSYPDFLQQDLDRDGYHYRVVNEGISGNTTKDGVDRLQGIVDMHAAVVVVEFGGNDGLRGLKIGTTRDNLVTMISALKAAGSKVVVAGITLPPDYGPDYVTQFTANYPFLGKKFNVPVLPFLLQNVYGKPGMMQADNTHATDKGNEIVARNVLPLVEPLLHR